MRGGGIAGVQALGRVRVIAAPTSSPPSASGTVAQQAFGDASGGAAPSPRAPLHPAGAFGLKFWLGVAAIGGLWWIYYHLPE